MNALKDFTVGPYRCRFGPSQSASGFSVWLWNAYYWQIEIEEAHDFDGAKNAMQFKLQEHEEAVALGFQNAAEAKEHQAWLEANGTPEYKAWSKSFPHR